MQEEMEFHMKYLTVMLFALLFMPQAEARHYTHYGHSFERDVEMRPLICRSKLRKAGYLARGKGSTSRNFHTINACVMNGGRI
jgi:hypothetical protein